MADDAKVSPFLPRSGPAAEALAVGSDRAMPGIVLSVPATRSTADTSGDDFSLEEDSTRWTSRHVLVLTIACLVTSGNYYCYDTPSALNTLLQTHLQVPYATWQWQLNMLYAVYSLPNIVLPLIGGILVDRVGPARTLIGFALLIVIGQGLLATGIQARFYSLMLFGRFLFGLGGETLEVAQSVVTTAWFGSLGGLGFALGCHLAAARIATGLNDNISPWVAAAPVDVETQRASGMSPPWAPPSPLATTRDSSGTVERLRVALGGVTAAAWVGFGVCVLSLGAAFWVVYLDRPASRLQAGIPLLDSDDRAHAHRCAEDEEASACHAGSDGEDADGCESRPLLPSSRASETMSEGTSASYDEPDETIHFGQLTSFPLTFWMLCAACIMLYGAAVPFFHICTDFFQEKYYPGDPQQAGFVMSIPDGISAFGSPLCGFFVDRVGRRGSLLITASLLIFITHGLLAFTRMAPIFPMVLLGVSYSVFAAALWPCVPLLVGRHQIATAYGLVTVALNMALAVFPLIVAHLRNAALARAALRPAVDTSLEDPLSDSGFFYVQLFFMALSGGAVIASAVLTWLDRRNGCKLMTREMVSSFSRSATASSASSSSLASPTSPSSPSSPSITEAPIRPPLGTIIEPTSPRRLVTYAPDEAAVPLLAGRPLGRRRRSTGNALTLGRPAKYGGVTVRVMREGLAIQSPATWVHHHHHHHADAHGPHRSASPPLPHGHAGPGRPASASPQRHGTFLNLAFGLPRSTTPGAPDRHPVFLGVPHGAQSGHAMSRGLSHSTGCGTAGDGVRRSSPDRRRSQQRHGGGPPTPNPLTASSDGESALVDVTLARPRPLRPSHQLPYRAPSPPLAPSGLGPSSTRQGSGDDITANAPP